MKISVIHGPNLNLLGIREPEVYGRNTLDEINEMLKSEASQFGATVECFQSNSEGALVDRVQAARQICQGILINPGGYTHTSVALRDALLAVRLPTVEVHLSNPDSREAFRRRSYLADVVTARIQGFGAYGYRLALDGLIAILKAAEQS